MAINLLRRIFCFLFPHIYLLWQSPTNPQKSTDWWVWTSKWPHGVCFHGTQPGLAIVTSQQCSHKLLVICASRGTSENLLVLRCKRRQTLQCPHPLETLEPHQDLCSQLLSPSCTHSQVKPCSDNHVIQDIRVLC